MKRSILKLIILSVLGVFTISVSNNLSYATSFEDCSAVGNDLANCMNVGGGANNIWSCINALTPRQNTCVFSIDPCPEAWSLSLQCNSTFFPIEDFDEQAAWQACQDAIPGRNQCPMPDGR